MSTPDAALPMEMSKCTHKSLLNDNQDDDVDGDSLVNCLPVLVSVSVPVPLPLPLADPPSGCVMLWTSCTCISASPTLRRIIETYRDTLVFVERYCVQEGIACYIKNDSVQFVARHEQTLRPIE